MRSSIPNLEILKNLTYHSISDVDYPASMPRRQSFVEDTVTRKKYRVEMHATSGQYGKVRYAYDFDDAKKVAFVVKELFDFDKETKLQAEKERKQLIKAWGGCGFQVTKFKIRFFMPYLGQPLSEAITKITDEKKIVTLAIKTASQVIFWHQLGMTHNDLHQNNILIDGDQVNLCDAGMSCDVGEKTSGAWAPTCIQVAPELKESYKESILADPKQDAFSMGQLLQPYYGFGLQLKKNNSFLSIHFEAIAFALTRVDPKLRISVAAAREQLNYLLEKYAFLLACHKDDRDLIQKELAILTASKKRKPEIELFLALQCQSVNAVELILEEKLDLNYVYNNETLLMLALKMFKGRLVNNTICLKLINHCVALNQLESVLNTSYDCITKLSSYERYLYREKFSHFEALQDFFSKKEISELKFGIHSEDFVTFRYFINEVPYYLLGEDHRVRQIIFEWFKNCIETNNFKAFRYLTDRHCPNIFKIYIQEERKPAPICRAATLGHFQIVQLLEKNQAYKSPDFPQCMEEGLKRLEMKGLVQLLKTDSDIFFSFEGLPQDPLFAKSRNIIETIIKKGIKELIEKEDKDIIRKLKFIIEKIPKNILKSMNLIQYLDLTLKKENIFQLFLAHPIFKSEIHKFKNELHMLFNIHLKAHNFDAIAKIKSSFPDIYDEWMLGLPLNAFKNAILGCLKDHLINKNLDDIIKIKISFPHYFQLWLLEDHQKSINFAIREMWVAGINFLIAEDKDRKLNISIMDFYFTYKEYKALGQINKLHPDALEKILLPRILKCVYFGNLKELKELQSILPDSFNNCLFVRNDRGKNILDLLAEEKAGAKYYKGYSLFDTGKSLFKADINIFPCGPITKQDKSLRISNPTKYSEIYKWLINFETLEIENPLYLKWRQY